VIEKVLDRGDTQLAERRRALGTDALYELDRSIEVD
jgi:hypothetical protein